MRDVPGRSIAVCGTEIYVEESGSGETTVVFESGTGAGRTLWDPVAPLLADIATTVAYDRAGRGRSGPPRAPQCIDDMAATLTAVVEALAPGRVILVAHSMGGLVVRRAAENLAPAGLVLVDPTPEAAPSYDDWAATARKTDRILAVQQSLARIRPLMRGMTASYGRMFPADTYATMLAEDFTPEGLAQTRRELAAVEDGIIEFRSRPPQPPACEIVVLSATRANRLRSRNHATLREYQRRYADQVGGRFEDADSEHIVPAEQPAQIAAAVRRVIEAGG
ncbi:pimeloyl-ACP methyl ester carboxylesterase [Nocardia transvalensis]|uniref:Pimeloyl-ACP methyl ester carboxylesterase n=1 Tax=Nocardia transvalensis TaxID=37333 RepID=A0A7W9PHP6_9NOCA|nr:alpha/beta hydrolase [Nocardia transvalensis]MBB5915913.1 pimeloyl-ACP methyl ester carboxylesterase [Nocardia transvalensis]